MNSKRRILVEEAHSIGMQLGINWTKIDLEEFRCGLEFELEHSTYAPETNDINRELILLGKIAWSRLNEIRDFYTLLDHLTTEDKVQPWTTDWLLGRVRKRILPIA